MRRRSAALQPGALPPHLQKLQDEKRAQIAASKTPTDGAPDSSKSSNAYSATSESLPNSSSSFSANSAGSSATSAAAVSISVATATTAAEVLAPTSFLDAASPSAKSGSKTTVAGSETRSLEGNSKNIPVRDFEWHIGVHHDQGIRFTMEDAESIMTSIQPTELGRIVESQPRACPQLAFFGVYDGHGGSAAAEFCRLHLPSTVLQAVKARLDGVSTDAGGDESCGKDSDMDAVDDEKLVKDAIRLAFVEADNTFLKICKEDNLGNVGTTVTTALCMGDSIYCANAGDSRTVLSRNGKAINLSEDHKPSNTMEEKRVREAGGFVVMGRVMGKLAVSRAIGDAEFKNLDSRLLSEFSISSPLVIPDPDIKVSRIHDKDEFLILACDGLWDIFSSQEAVDMVSNSLDNGDSAEDAAKLLVNTALKKGSRDNVTVLIAVIHRS